MLDWLSDLEELENTRSELYKRYARPLEIEFQEKNSEKLEYKGYDIVARSSEHAAHVKGSAKITKDTDIISLAEGIRRPLEIGIEQGKQAKISLLFDFDATLPSEVRISVGEHATLTLYETIASSSSTGGILLQEINIEEGAGLNLVLLNKDRGSYALLNLLHANERSNAILTNALFGGDRLRYSTIGVAERKSSIAVHSAIVANNEQKADIMSLLVNEGQASNVSSITRAILLDSAECLVKEFAKIRQRAEEASSTIEEKGLLLSNGANFVPMPDMAVDTNNVANASHSSAVLPLSKKSIFYMTSRGISEKDAKSLFAMGFAEKILAGKFEDERGKKVLNEIEDSLHAKLNK